MWPWGHLAFGYLLGSGWKRLDDGRPLTRGEALALALGTQFPDAVDKPLAWTWGLLPSGRSLAHSVFTALAVLVGASFVPDDRPAGAYVEAFAVGWLSHLLGDALRPAFRRRPSRLRFLAWPLTATDREVEGGFQEVFGRLERTDLYGPEAAVVAVAVAWWARRWLPGSAHE